MTIADDTKSLSIEITGYEFAYTHRREPYDSDNNWLYIQVKYSDKDREWRCAGPALLTWEAESLVEFLCNPPGEGVGAAEIEFIEPNLSFIISRRGKAGYTLTVILSLEFNPPFSGKKYFKLEFEASADELSGLASQMEGQISRFPVRR